MYYTNIEDYEQLLSQREESSSENGIVLAIVVGLVTALFV
jgi:hypothetical protein